MSCPQGEFNGAAYRIHESMADDWPRSMRDPGVQRRRKAMLDLPHIAPLAAYVDRLRNRGLGYVPDFDPCDGGTEAHVLFLFEKPGPMTVEGGERAGSGFISRNNDDGTAAATFNFMEQAHIPRKLTVIWNVIPWWNGTRKVNTSELREGTACVKALVNLLPALKVVVMVGCRAARAKPFLETAGVALLTSYHPSPVVRATNPERWKGIASEWANAFTFLTIDR